ncbi:MAG: CvpA family protein [Saezia sp.]
MPVLDLVVIGIVAVSMLVGIMRGFIYEAAMILGWFLAFFVAKFFAPQLSELFVGAISHPSWRMGAAFSIIFIAVLFTNSILAFFLKSLFSKSALRPMDRLLGSLFGVVRAGVVLVVVALVVHILRLQEESWWVEAKTAPVLNEAIAVARPHLRSILNLDDQEVSDKVDLLNDVGSLLDRQGSSDDASEKPVPNDREKALLELLRNTQNTQGSRE